MFQSAYDEHTDSKLKLILGVYFTEVSITTNHTDMLNV